LLGIEKILPRLEDLALFLPMLSTIGTGPGPHVLQLLLTAVPGRPANRMGRKSFTSCCWTTGGQNCSPMGNKRDALHCIRAGAVSMFVRFSASVAATPITPRTRGRSVRSLRPIYAACRIGTPFLCQFTLWRVHETCPVKINLHHHLLHNRRNASRQRAVSGRESCFQVVCLRDQSPRRVSDVKKGRAAAANLSPSSRARVSILLMSGQTRDLPPIAPQTF